MLAIEMSLSIYLLFGIVLLAFCTGFILRSKQLSSLKKKISELEKEMLGTHADILELQKEKATLEHKLEASKIPVIPLNSKEENTSEKLSDLSKKKKTL